MSVTPGCVVITGASSGFGVEFARRFAAAGADVILVARRLDRLAALAEELSAAHRVRAVPIAADLSLPGAAQQLVGEIDARGMQPDGLVNNAGFGIDGPLAGADVGDVHRLLQVNVVTLTELSVLLLPRLAAHESSVLVNVASTASFQPIPNLALDAASKAYVRTLTEALWKESQGTGLKVLALCPGPTETEFFQVAGSERFKVGQMLTIPQVVDHAFDALGQRGAGPTRIAGWRNRVTAFAPRLVPTRTALAVAGNLTKD